MLARSGAEPVVSPQLTPPLINLWLTPQEAADYLQVERRTVLKWANTGQLRGYALSGTERRTWRFKIEDLDAKLRLSSEPLSTSGRVQ